jgi:hypothetical protein
MKIRPAKPAAFAALIGIALGSPFGAYAQPVVPLKEAKLNIEHNFTDEDTGFQGAIDSEGWKSLQVKGPEGVVLEFEAEGKLRALGLTELFFESVEPANADVPINQMLAKLPAGNYRISGPVPANQGGGTTAGTAWLTHDIPKGPTLLAPTEGAIVPASDLLVRWSPVTKTITGAPVKIIAYQLIVEKDGPPHPHMIGKPNSLSMYLPPSVTRITVPGGFLEPGTPYLWEVLAIEKSGNQTLSSSEFSTR